MVGVGGPTLGGSYKTPLVLALCQALEARGERVAVVGHGYASSASRLGTPRRVGPEDSPSSVGDDALWLYRELSPGGVPVIVGGTRSAALALAATFAPRVIVDGLLQAEPQRLALSVLAVDAEHPWGAGRCPPAGDLRATSASLLAATDVVARVRSSVSPPSVGGPEKSVATSSSSWMAGAGSAVEVVEVAFHLLGATDWAGHRISFASLAGSRVGVVLAVARPDRVLASLASWGIDPVETRLFGDHESPRPRRIGPCGQGEGTRPDVWLTTPKCATKMAAVYDGAPVLVFSHRFTLPQALIKTLMARTDR